MNSLTEAFDIALQVRVGMIKAIVRSMHRAGIARHHYVRNFQGKRVELLINSPELTFVNAPQPDDTARVRLTSRVFYHSRRVDDAGDPGVGAVADVTIRVALKFSSPSPAPLNGVTSLLIDWQETGRKDITVPNVTAEIENEVKDALLEFVRDQGASSFTIPPIGVAPRQVGSLAFRFLPQGTFIEDVVVAGLNLGATIKGSANGLQQVFLKRDWALALSDSFVLSLIRDGLRQQFGGNLPPPHGSQPITISDRNVCVLDSPFGCLNYARQRIILQSLDVSLEPDKIVFSGRVAERTDSWYVPDLDATFRAEVSLKIGPNQDLIVTVSQPTVQLDQWYAQVLDFISLHTIEGLVRDGVRSALQSGASQGEISSFISSALLRALSSYGSTANVQIGAAAAQVEIRGDAVIVHGQMNVGPVSAPPQSALGSLPASDVPWHLILYGGNSWVPGGRVTQLLWEFGDGQTLTQNGADARFVTAHYYTPGVYTACLTVSDEEGSKSRSCTVVRPGVLTVRHKPEKYHGREMDEWEVCRQDSPFNVEFQVLSGSTPVAGVVVRASTPGWEASGATNQEGNTYLRLDPARFGQLIPPAHGEGTIGGININISKQGVQLGGYVLWVVDCARRDGTKVGRSSITGEFVSIDFAKQHPDTTEVERVRKSSQDTTKKRYKTGRSSKTGRFVPVEEARAHPDETEIETIKRTPRKK